MADSQPWAENIQDEPESVIMPKDKKVVDVLGSFPKDSRANFNSLSLATDGKI